MDSDRHVSVLLSQVLNILFFSQLFNLCNTLIWDFFVSNAVNSIFSLLQSFLFLNEMPYFSLNLLQFSHHLIFPLLIQERFSLVSWRDDEFQTWLCSYVLDILALCRQTSFQTGFYFLLSTDFLDRSILGNWDLKFICISFLFNVRRVLGLPTFLLLRDCVGNLLFASLLKLFSCGVLGTSLMTWVLWISSSYWAKII